MLLPELPHGAPLSSASLSSVCRCVQHASGHFPLCSLSRQGIKRSIFIVQNRSRGCCDSNAEEDGKVCMGVLRADSFIGMNLLEWIKKTNATVLLGSVTKHCKEGDVMVFLPLELPVLSPSWLNDLKDTLLLRSPYPQARMLSRASTGSS